MNDQNQNKQKQKQEETPKTLMGETSAAKSSSRWGKLFAKRWVSPAIFMAAAAIIVTLMWIYQGTDQTEPTTAGTDPTDVTQEEGQPPVVEGNTENDGVVDVIVEGETLQWPVANIQALQIETPFYDAKASSADREAAVIQVNNTFMVHTGIDFVDPDGGAFDVQAAMSGKVTHVGQHPTNGNVIEIDHGEGFITVYQSVADIQVAVGDEVLQGAIIAKAGRSEIESDLGNHLHFEARMNGQAVNPSDYM